MSNSSIYDSIHGLVPEISQTELGFVSAFMALSLGIVLEFHIRIFRFFKKRSGLYFWSLLVLSWGVLLHSIGYLLNWFALDCPWQLYALIDAFGWSMMVTAESLVLYSRMHLVTRNRNVHRLVLGMIVFTALFIQIPDWCISIPATSKDPAVSAVWSPRDSIETRIQQVAFLLQESTISGLYIFYIGKLLRPNLQIAERRVMLDLIYVNSIVIILDIVVIILAFTNQRPIKESLQNFSYALKLKLEFFVLNQLVEVSQEGFSSGSGEKGRYVEPSPPDDRGHSGDMKTSAQMEYRTFHPIHSLASQREGDRSSTVQPPTSAYLGAGPSTYPPDVSPARGTSPEPMSSPPDISQMSLHPRSRHLTLQTLTNEKPLPSPPSESLDGSWLHLTDSAPCDRTPPQERLEQNVEPMHQDDSA